MDQDQHGQQAQEAHGKNQYQSNLMPNNPSTQTLGPSIILSSYPKEQQLQQEHMQKQLNNFWEKQCKEIEETINFKPPSFPLSRIKRIMKANTDVSMVSAEAPVLFAKACEMFVMELTLRSWANAEEEKRRTLKKSNITSTIIRNDVFGFLVGVIGDKTMNHQVFEDIPRNDIDENVPNYYMSPHQQRVLGPPYGVPIMDIGRPILDQNHHGMQTHPSPTQMFPDLGQQNNLSPKSDD